MDPSSSEEPLFSEEPCSADEDSHIEANLPRSTISSDEHQINMNSSFSEKSCSLEEPCSPEIPSSTIETEKANFNEEPICLEETKSTEET